MTNENVILPHKAQYEDIDIDEVTIDINWYNQFLTTFAGHRGLTNQQLSPALPELLLSSDVFELFTN